MSTLQKTEIKKAVSTALREVLSDPDYNLEITPVFKRKIEAARRDIRTGKTKKLRSFLQTKK